MSSPTGRFDNDIHPTEEAYQYPDRAIDCQVSIDDAFRELWDKSADMGWGPEEIAAALYDLTDNHLTALRQNHARDRRLAAKGED